MAYLKIVLENKNKDIKELKYNLLDNEFVGCWATNFVTASEPMMSRYQLFDINNMEEEWLKQAEMCEVALHDWNDFVNQEYKDVSFKGNEIQAVGPMIHANDTLHIYDYFLDMNKENFFGREFFKIDKSINENLCSPIIAKVIIIHKWMMEKNVQKGLDKLLNLFNMINALQWLGWDYIDKTDRRCIWIKMKNDTHRLLKKEDHELFSYNKSFGDLFLSGNVIGTTYENWIANIHTHIDQHRVPRTVSNSNSLLAPQISYSTEIKMYFGGEQKHEDFMQRLNESLDVAWGGFKVKKTDTSNPYGWGSFGYIKIGKLETEVTVEELLDYTKVISYALE